MPKLQREKKLAHLKHVPKIMTCLMLPLPPLDPQYIVYLTFFETKMSNPKHHITKMSTFILHKVPFEISKEGNQ
jgi:hypothetical protein